MTHRPTPSASSPARSASARRRRVAGVALAAVLTVAALAGAAATGVIAVAPGGATGPVPTHATTTHDAVPAPATSAPRGTQTIVVTVPDLQQEVREMGAAAPYGLRRAACHQETAMDDESKEPLATCLADIPQDAPRP